MGYYAGAREPENQTSTLPDEQKPNKIERKPITESLAEYIQLSDANAEIIGNIEKVRKFQQLKMGEFNYFGKIIDQHGEPVVGAKVQMEIGYYPFIPNGNFYPSYRKRVVETDAEGKFSIMGEKGESFSFDLIEKEGYEIDRTGFGGAILSRGGVELLKRISNPDKPVIFHAWKKSEAEPLIHNEILIGFSPDGKRYAVDLITPKKVVNGNSGDIIISFNRHPNAKFNEGFDWNVTLMAIGGGVTETNDLFMNEAPEGGYESVWSLEMKKSEPDYQRDAKRKFYLKSRNGKVFGRLEFEFIPLYNKDSVIDAKWWLNPNGSRNLQYDPKKRIWPQ